MLQIRLNTKGSASEGTGGGGGKSSAGEIVTVACPDHLVLADLPVAKSIGTASTVSIVKIVGRRSRRHLGERVHFCVRCDFPIAIYGRLSPCEHAFCLDCARSDSSCYLCDERIQKIQTIKMMEGIFICAAPHCLKSFMKKPDFESHIQEIHSDLLQPNAEKEDGNESDNFNATRASSTDAHAKQSTTGDTSTARTLPRAGFSPSSNSLPSDIDDKARRNQPRDQPPLKPSIIQPKPPPFYGRQPNYPELQPENNPPSLLDRSGRNRLNNQQGFDVRSGPPQRRDSDQFPEKQQGLVSDFPFPDFPQQSPQPPSFLVPVNANQGMAPSVYSMPPFSAEGAQPFYNVHFETARPDMPSESGAEQGSLLGFPPALAVGNSFTDGYPRPWNMSPGVPFEQIQASQAMSEAYANQSDSQVRATYIQGDYGRASGAIPLIPPMLPTGSASDNLDRKGVLAPQPRPPPPPPPLHPSQFQRGNFSHPGDAVREGQNYGWQHEKHDGYGGSQEQ